MTMTSFNSIPSSPECTSEQNSSHSYQSSIGRTRRTLVGATRNRKEKREKKRQRMRALTLISLAVTFVSSVQLTSPPISKLEPNVTRSRGAAAEEQEQLNCDATVFSDSCDYCGISSRTRIVGGRSAVANEFPWMVALVYMGEVFCGGSLITHNLVVTAAHCVESFRGRRHRKKLRLYLKLQDKSRLKEAIERRAKRLVPHPGYNVYTSENDIALVRLDRKVRFSAEVHPVCLPCPDVNVTSENVTVVGWGAVQEDGDTADNLRKVTLPIVDYEQCYETLSNYSFVTLVPSMLCAGLIEGGKDSCQGDSGGPLMWLRNGVWHQVGVVSWGEGCARVNSYGVYTRMTAFLHWIHRYTCRNNSC